MTTTYTPTAERPPTVVLPPTPENVERCTSIISHAFTTTPLLITFVSELDGLTTATTATPAARTAAIDQPRRHAHFLPGIARVATTGALLLQSGAWSAVAVWEPPTFAGEDFASARPRWGPMSRVWTAAMMRSRARHLGVPAQRDPAAVAAVDEATVLQLRPFWHLSFLARNTYPDAPRVAGAISSVVLPYLEKAREEGVPAWLEATTPTAVAMYEFWGFRVVDEVRFGQGLYNAEGWPEEGGKGVSAWCMIYDGHLKGEDA